MARKLRPIQVRPGEVYGHKLCGVRSRSEYPIPKLYTQLYTHHRCIEQEYQLRVWIHVTHPMDILEFIPSEDIFHRNKEAMDVHNHLT